MLAKVYIKRAIFFLSWIMLLYGMLSQEIVFADDMNQIEEVYVANEVIASANSLEEAEQIAKLHNITLKSYSYGIAVFTTIEVEGVNEAQDAILTEDLPELYYNRVYTILEVEEGEDTENRTVQSYLYHHSELDTESAFAVTRGEGIVVAVIDTGADIGHAELSRVILENSYNSYTESVGLEAVTDDHGHGTHVCGIIAAATEDGNQVYGVAPDVELLVIKADRSYDNNFELSSLLRAINYAVSEGADIINMSLGASYSAGVYEIEQSTIAAAVAAGVTVICAAGNDGYGHADYPAAYEETIAVAAVGEGYDFASGYSNYGSEIDVAAQGTLIYSSVIDGYGYKTGTSMACPMVVGVAALIKSIHPEYTPAELETALYGTVQDAGALGWDQYYGYGVIHAYAAVLGVDELYTVQYDYSDDEREIITTKVVPGNTLIEPDNPADLENGRTFIGWFLEGEEDSFDFTQNISENTTLYAQWSEPLISISGSIKVYNIQANTIIELKKDGAVEYSIEIEPNESFGEVNQTFTIEGIEEGVYELVINKACHLEYRIVDIVISGENIDLTTHSNRNISTITMLVGDVNSNGVINADDANEMRSSLNYLKNTEEAINYLTDINGNGVINADDVNEVRSSLNYLKNSEDCIWYYKSVVNK